MQLQHHEILKASLLSKIVRSKTLRINYGKLWDACADMNTYVERALRLEAGSSVAKFYHEGTGRYDFNQILSMMSEEDISAKPLRLSEIIDSYKPKHISQKRKVEFEEHPETTEDAFEAVRSILSFPQLLQHTLRIHRKRRGKEDITRINEKELLQSFKATLKEMNEEEALDFLRLLFEVRVCFDRHIIKWVTIAPNEEVHLLKRLVRKNRDYGSKTYFHLREKTKEVEDFALLQSMLYHTQQITTQYWLTPMLMEMLKSNDEGAHYRYLRKLDNYLYSTGKKEEDAGIRTWQLLDAKIPSPAPEFRLEILMNADGTGFAHYWFYKLEFVLWFLKRTDHQDWSNFRFTAKNSIEHVSPQKRLPQDFNGVSSTYLDTFGNLALVTRSINSEFGNKEYNVKRKQFLNKKEDGKLESLKLDIIYRSPHWNDDLCNKHRHDMIELLRQYLNISI
ncbi:HNH endonuclease family protein [Mucilaginibacter lacusdianchii]|uniref:HNH endonuclease family protein n=1 Tax=Mucilaginibacter lacusdianchii TaxID=2684211 RepID=UPI00131C75EC|nr:HNH endonuclease family protein [Mucilaginibacter sp. JXJ CY 39]